MKNLPTVKGQRRHADTEGPGGMEPLRQLLGRRDSHHRRQPRSRDHGASRPLLRPLRSPNWA